MNTQLNLSAPLPASSRSILTKRMVWIGMWDEPRFDIGQCIPLTICEPVASRPQGLPGYVRIGAKMPSYGTWVAEVSTDGTTWFKPSSSYAENGEVFLIQGGWVRAIQEDQWYVRVRRIA
jgi:hypothetical protein